MIAQRRRLSTSAPFALRRALRRALDEKGPRGRTRAERRRLRYYYRTGPASSFAPVFGGKPSGAATLAGAETDGLFIDLTDLSMIIRDTATPANSFIGDPNTKLTYSSPSTKWILNRSGVYESGTTLRTEYDINGVALGCRIEEARTNLTLRSQAFDNAAWAKSSCSITADQIASPDGTTNADLFTEATANAPHNLQNAAAVTVTTGVAYAVSVYVKAGTCNFITLTHYLTTNNWAAAVFDLTDGLTTASQTAVGATTGTITSTNKENVGNGWFRLTIVASATGTGQLTLIGAAPAGTGNTINTDGLVSFVGTSRTFYVWQAQLELGAFPTSPIVTAGSTVTRAADNISIATSLFNMSATACTVYAKGASMVASAGSSQRGFLQTDDGTANNALLLYLTGTTSLPSFFVINGGASQANISQGSAIAANTFYRLAGSASVNDFRFSRDGNLGTPDVSGSMPAASTTLRIGSRSAAASPINGWVSQIMVLPRTSTDPQLQAYGT